MHAVAGGGERGHVLVIEDNVVQQMLFAATLQRAGYEVECLKDAISALDLIDRKSFVAIVLDLRMAIFDGNQFLEYLKTARPELIPRVIVVTAFSSLLLKVPTAEVACVLQKPIKGDQLVEAVRIASSVPCGLTEN
jgi:DNA-binding NtrC family response regulator